MLTLFSPAKINLFLKVLGKRPDGYHELASLFQAIDLGDILTFELSEQDELTCSDPALPLDSSNLVLRAADLFRRKTGIRSYLKIHLRKNIPARAGLGGGSGNAATTLWAFNRLAGGIVEESRLREWSKEIGSDIPFFFSSGTAYCTGRGEHVHSLPKIPVDSSGFDSCLIVMPKYGLSTPDVFQRLGFSPQSPDTFDRPPTMQSFSIDAAGCFNDLEKSAFALQPNLKILKDRLLSCGYPVVLMSGSGSAFFCLGRSTVSSLPGLDVFTFSARFLNRNSVGWYMNLSR